MNQTIVIDGRQVIITFDPGTGVTTATFPDIHNDNLNPNDPLVITITPSMTFSGAMDQFANILAANPVKP